jgi:RNA polymerase sigma-54 factor
MPVENRLDIRLSQKLILTPQIQLAIKLLEMQKLELVETLNQELVENPFLEELTESLEEISEDEKIQEEITPESNDEEERPLERLLEFTSLSSSVDEYFDERASDGRDLGYFNPGKVETPSFEKFVSKKPDLSEHLLWQLRLSHVSDEVRMAGEVVIGNIDEHGYLRATVEELSQSSGFSPQIIEKGY